MAEAYKRDELTRRSDAEKALRRASTEEIKSCLRERLTAVASLEEMRAELERREQEGEPRG